MKEIKCQKCGRRLRPKKRLAIWVCVNKDCSEYYYNTRKGVCAFSAVDKKIVDKKIKVTTVTDDKSKEVKTVIKTNKFQEHKTEIQSIKSTAEIVDVKSLIPNSNGYISRNIYGTTDIKILNNLYKDKRPVLIVGETGCGKTHAIRNFCYVNKLSYRRVSLNGGTTAEDLLGQYVPNSEGKFTWVDGWLTYFARNGGVIVLDEVNGCSAEILFALHSITDDERTLTLTQKDGETIKAHPNLWIVGTMNESYEGTKPLNKAFKDRFRILPWGYDEKVEEKLGISKKLLVVTKRLREMYKLEELSYPISTRTLIQYQEDTKSVGKRVAKELLFNKFEIEEERKAVKEMFDLKEKVKTNKEMPIKGIRGEEVEGKGTVVGIDITGKKGKIVTMKASSNGRVYGVEFDEIHPKFNNLDHNCPGSKGLWVGKEHLRVKKIV